MTTLTKIIEDGEKKAGSQKALADILEVAPQTVADAKKGRRGLPTVQCGKLADFLGIDHWTVVCASDLMTEKNEKRRAYLTPFVEGTRRAAVWILGAGIAGAMTFASTKAEANDTLFVSHPSYIPVTTRVSEGQLPSNTNYARLLNEAMVQTDSSPFIKLLSVCRYKAVHTNALRIAGTCRYAFDACC